MQKLKGFPVEDQPAVPQAQATTNLYFINGELHQLYSVKVDQRVIFYWAPVGGQGHEEGKEFSSGQPLSKEEITVRLGKEDTSAEVDTVLRDNDPTRISGETL